MLLVPVPLHQFTFEDYKVAQDRVDVKLEFVRGEIYPKEGKTPLPVEVVEKILSPNFNLQTLDYEFPMATSRHARIIQNLTYALISELDRELFEVYIQDPQIYISLTGSYRFPDITIAPTYEKQAFKGESLVNPILIIEVLSPSNVGDAFMDKVRDYQCIESLQEYWFISQDLPLLERFVRDRQGWLTTVFDENNEKIDSPALATSMPLMEIYRNIFESKK